MKGYLRIARAHNCVLFITGLAVMLITTSSLNAGTASISLSTTQQTVRGFGAASVWMGALSTTVMDKAYTANAGCIGLTINRCRIDPSQAWSDELTNAKNASSRGAIVFATPWTPPASMKSNNNTVGGSLNTSQYAAYASFLNSFTSYLSSNGVSLYAISMQNEPDITVTYESCDWTPTQILNFVKNNGGSISTKLIAAESFHFDHSYTDPILSDSTASANLDIVGGHIYGGGLADYASARSAGKEVWMTEHLNTDTTITGQIQTAKEMLDCFAVGNFNAYVWWYVKRTYGPIDDSENRTKRGCVMAQFARWIRPGYTRVGATYNPTSNIYVAAFKSGSKSVIVAVNTSSSSVSQTFTYSSGTAPSSVTPYRTSGSEDLATLSTISVSSASFTATLPAQSITSFVSP